MTVGPPQAPHGVSATGVQRAIGERRRRRERERGGHVDLDATMSSWPSPDPPTRARQGPAGAAIAPVLPTPQTMLVREQTEPAPRGSTAVPAGRRGRRSAGVPDTNGPGPHGAASPFGPAGPSGSGPAAGASAGAPAGVPRPGSPAGPAALVLGAAIAATGTAVAARSVRSDRSRSLAPVERTERRAASDPGLRVVTQARPRASEPAEPVAPAAPAERRRARATDAETTAGPPAFPDSDPFSAFGARPPAAAATRRPRAAVAAVAAPVAAVPVNTAPAGAVGQSPTTAPAAPAVTESPARADAGPVRLRRRARAAVDASPAQRVPADRRGAIPQDPPVREPLGLRGTVGHLADNAFSRSGPPAPDERPSRRWPPSAPVLGAVVAVLVALVVTGALLLRPGDGTGPTTALVAPQAPQQDTVLVTLLGDEGTVSRAMLLAVGPEASGSGDRIDPVLVSGDLTVPVPDAGSLPLAQSITVDAQAPDRAVEDMLGVRVDGTWVMDAGLLAEHVDTAGGVEVDVATPVVAGDVTVPVGTDQLLTGAQAAAYATTAIDGEEPDALLARFSQVVLGLVAAMPQESGEVTQLLSQVDRHPATTSTSEQLSRMLATSAVLIADQGVPTSAAVPTTGGEGSPVVADAEAVEALVDERLAGARLPESVVGPLHVVVGNAVGEPGLVTAARDRLVEAGFRFVGGGTVEGEAAPATTVLVPEDTPENRERGLAVAAALGVPAEALFVKEDFTADVPEGTDIIVWLGQDYVVEGAGDASGDGGGQ